MKTRSVFFFTSKLRFAFRFLLLNPILLSGVEALSAPLRVQNRSPTDYLSVATILSDSDRSVKAQGFWKIDPKMTVTLFPDDSNIENVWLRVLVETPTDEVEILPSKRYYLDLEGHRDCAWNNDSPAVFFCAASPYRGGMEIVLFDLGTKSIFSALRESLEKNEHLRFFKLDRNSNNEFEFIWQ